MSIFGNLGGMLGSLFDQYGGPQVVLTQVFNQMGGVEGVLQKLQQAGLGGQVSSWLGKGANQSISADDIGNALGHTKIGDLASRLGIPPDQLSQMIAHALPGLIDRISPGGTLQPHLLQDGAAAPSSLDPRP